VTTVLQLAVNLLAPMPPLASLPERIRDALLTPLTGAAAGHTGLILGAYAPLALGVGRRSGFLLALWRWPPLGVLLRGSLPLLLMPALGEELLFRVALLPHPAGGPNLANFWAWGALNVGLFVVYHPLAARLWDRRQPAVFDDPRFLLQCALLGSACVLAYGASGSLWAPVLIHWLAVAAWLGPLEGHRCLPGAKPHQSAPP
jgi:predicted Abi (CAAX) family protease